MQGRNNRAEDVLSTRQALLNAVESEIQGAVAALSRASCDAVAETDFQGGDVTRLHAQRIVKQVFNNMRWVKNVECAGQ